MVLMRTAGNRVNHVHPGSKDPFPIRIRPSGADIATAHAIARNTEPAPEVIARALTWGADENVLLVLAAAGWLASRWGAEPLRRAGNHAMLVTVAASLLPHGMKLLFDQTRPDRRTVVGHVHGISFSGKRDDAFPSGHALHMGALASAAGALPGRGRPVSDARSGSGALGERRRRRIRAWSGRRAPPATVDRLSARTFERG
jgi:undecaprenyl-diphosphatase